MSVNSSNIAQKAAAKKKENRDFSQETKEKTTQRS